MKYFLSVPFWHYEKYTEYHKKLPDTDENYDAKDHRDDRHFAKAILEYKVST